MDVNVKFTLRSQRSLSLAANSSEVKHYSQQTKKTSKQKHYKNVGTFFFFNSLDELRSILRVGCIKKRKKKKKKKRKKKKRKKILRKCFLAMLFDQ